MAVRWMVAWTYIGTVIGAGFASGQELVQFFVPYGLWGVTGALLAGLILGWAGACLLAVCQNKRDRYYGLLKALLGARLGGILAALMTVFLFLGLTIMFAASGAMFVQQFGLPFWLGVGLTWALVVLAALARAEGILAFNTLLVPALCLGLLLIGLWGLTARAAPGGTSFAPPNPLAGLNWTFSALLYASYNFILGAAVLAGLPVDEKEGRLGAWAGGLGLGLLAALAVLALLNNPGSWKQEIPLLYLARATHQFAGAGLSLALWLAALTTAVGDVFGLAGEMERQGHRWGRSVLALTLPAIPLASLGFQALVAFVYPLLGYLGLLLLGGVARDAARRLMRLRKERI